MNPPTTKIDVWSLGCILLEMSGKDLNAFSKWVEQHIANRDERVGVLDQNVFALLFIPK